MYVIVQFGRFANDWNDHEIISIWNAAFCHFIKFLVSLESPCGDFTKWPMLQAMWKIEQFIEYKGILSNKTTLRQYSDNLNVLFKNILSANTF